MSGPFYFAWVAATETTFGVEHQREDEKVLDLKIEHAEGELPSLEVEIENPRVGLLAPGRNIWAWLSWFDGTSVVPLFFGRLVGIPSDIFAETVTLSLIAKPNDYAEQKQALGRAMKVRPYYDPVWMDVADRDNPDAILEGYSALWHVDRVTHVVTASDVLTGEDGTEQFDESEVPYDSVSFSVGEAPLRKVSVDARLTWTQQASGAIDLGAKYVETLTGASLLGGWPKGGESIGGGWTVQSGSIVDKYEAANGAVVCRQFHLDEQGEGTYNRRLDERVKKLVGSTAAPGDQDRYR